MWAAISGQLNGGDHAPRTLSASVADEKAKAQHAATRRIRFDMERPRIFFIFWWRPLLRGSFWKEPNRVAASHQRRDQCWRDECEVVPLSHGARPEGPNWPVTHLAVASP